MPKCVTLGCSNIIHEEGWNIEALYRLQVVEQSNGKQQVSFSKDR
jgi:hypothetical protein